jgi:hypothetical protein
MACLEALTDGAALIRAPDETTLAGVPGSRGVEHQDHIHGGEEPTVARAVGGRGARAGDERR